MFAKDTWLAQEMGNEKQSNSYYRKEVPCDLGIKKTPAISLGFKRRLSAWLFWGKIKAIFGKR